MTENQPTPEYKVPERFAGMTMHYLLGIDKPLPEMTTMTYLEEYSFGLLGDLVASHIPVDDIEAAVAEGNVNVAHWPLIDTKTDFFWDNREATLSRLDNLANEAVKLCYGQNEQEPVGGNMITVGATIGSQQLALAGLIYGREKGLLREMNELADPHGGGPLYVVRDSFSGQMFDKLMPEES